LSDIGFVGVQPPSLSRRELVILSATTRGLVHDPLYFDDESHNKGFGRIFKLHDDARARWLNRTSWGWTKPSHPGPHQYCHDEDFDGECALYDRNYWKKHPELRGYDAFAEQDAMLEAKWARKFAHPEFPLPRGF
jgi:hypothetical protein